MRAEVLTPLGGDVAEVEIFERDSIFEALIERRLSIRIAYRKAQRLSGYLDGRARIAARLAY